jgi:hypothetical protein
MKFSKDKSNKDGLRYQCKKCCKDNKKQYRDHNYEKVTNKKKCWCKDNPEKIAIMNKRYYENNRDKILVQKQQYGQSIAGRLVQKRTRIKKLLTPTGKLNHKMSTTIGRSLKQKNGSKNGYHWEILVGYKVSKLKSHLEKQFTKGMNWGNYGKWHIDHKKPIVYFNYDSPEHPEFKKCWGLRNLQPLWAKENDSKGAKLNWRG